MNNYPDERNVSVIFRADAVKISYCPERFEIRPQPQVIAHCFKFLRERVQRNFNQLKHIDQVINWTLSFRATPNPNS